MLDPKLLRTDLDTVVAKLRVKNYELDVDEFNRLEERRKAQQVETQNLQNERNTRSKAIGAAKARGEDIQPLLDEVATLGDQLKNAEAELGELQQQLDDMLLGIPNVPHESVPPGDSEDDNAEVLRWGEIPEFDFEAKDHIDLGQGLGPGQYRSRCNERDLPGRRDISRYSRRFLWYSGNIQRHSA